MRTAAFTSIVAAFTLSGCVDYSEAMQRSAECRAATTYGERYGTPNRRGPCWWRTTGHSAGFGVEVFSVEGPDAIASLAYEGNRLVSVTEVAKR